MLYTARLPVRFSNASNRCSRLHQLGPSSSPHASLQLPSSPAIAPFTPVEDPCIPPLEWALSSCGAQRVEREEHLGQCESKASRRLS
eukprot:485496-Pelagomonas_calceolata.AAC.2